MLGLSPSRVRQLADQGWLSFQLTAGGHRRFDSDQLITDWQRFRRRKDTPEAQPDYELIGLAEDAVWRDLRQQLETKVGSIPARAREILGYATTEMVNNAIDHSKGKTLDTKVAVVGRVVELRITDDGIGAFRSMAEAFGYEEYADAVVDVTKGRRTTDPAHHSGEGIFFTSKAVDVFSLEANGYRLLVDNLENDIALGAGGRIGTTIELKLSLETTRQLVDVFAAYTKDGEFIRTMPRVELINFGSEFLSRSQAKRFALGLEQFREVLLDFSGVDLVGQGFADELFRVWQSQHPEVRLEVTGANRGVDLMISRVARPTN